ncbi:MAG: LytR/AlgR family response regulator transcription factor [Schleiferiaceae bacterium]
MITVRHIGILDDEKLAVDGMVFQLSKLLPQANVEGFTQHKPFVQWCEEHCPEMVFLDMEMPGANGLEVAQSIKPMVGNIVFVTAHTEYSLEAFDTAVDYVLKPVSPKRLAQSLKKIAELKPVGTFEELRIKIPIKGSFHSLSESKINILQGQRNYTEVILNNGERHLVARTLKSFEEGLSQRFARIHKSVIVRRDAVKRIDWGSKILVHMTGGEVLEASKSRMNESDWADV